MNWYGNPPQPAPISQTSRRSVCVLKLLEHRPALEHDEHFEELQRVDVVQLAVDFVAEPAERTMFRHEQMAAARGGDERLELVRETPARASLIRPVVVRAQAGDVICVMPQLVDDERRGVEHVLERRQFFAPVRAGSVGMGPADRLEILDGGHAFANRFVRAVRGRVAKTGEARLQLGRVSRQLA